MARAQLDESLGAALKKVVAMGINPNDPQAVPKTIARCRSHKDPRSCVGLITAMRLFKITQWEQTENPGARTLEALMGTLGLGRTATKAWLGHYRHCRSEDLFLRYRAKGRPYGYSSRLREAIQFFLGEHPPGSFTVEAIQIHLANAIGEQVNSRRVRRILARMGYGTKRQFAYRRQQGDALTLTKRSRKR